MRAEISQSRRATIKRRPRAAEEASLTGISALPRLDELNARAEDPKLWNDAGDGAEDHARAQPAGGRDRAPARARAGARRRARAAELAEDEGDEAHRRRGRARRSARCRSRLDRLRAREPAVRRGRRQRRLPRGQRRRRRHRGAGLGRDAAAHVHCAGPSSTATRSSGSRRARARRPASSRRRSRSSAPNAYGWLKTESRRAPAGAHLAVRQQRAAAHQLRLGLGLSGGRRQHRDRDQLDKDLRSTPTAPRAPAASTSTRPTPRCASPTCRPASSSPARTTARSTATAPWPWRCCARGSTSWSCRSARRRPTALEAAKTDIGWGHQIRTYVLQPYQMVKDLRTGVETRQPAGRARRRPRRVPGGRAGPGRRRQGGGRRGLRRRRTARPALVACARVEPTGSPGIRWPSAVASPRLPDAPRPWPPLSDVAQPLEPGGALD